MSKATRSQIETLVRNREPFAGNSSTAEASPSVVNPGRLDGPEFRQLAEAAAAGRLSYVVYSYATPVAWVVDGAAHVTEQSFSPTTSRLQNLCRRALA